MTELTEAGLREAAHPEIRAEFEGHCAHLIRVFASGADFTSAATALAQFALDNRSAFSAALASTTPPAEAKTPDAGVGEPPHLSDLRGLFKDRYAADALAQPAPVGEDETGVREALAPFADCCHNHFHDRSVLDQFEDDESVLCLIRDGKLSPTGISVGDLRRATAAIAPQPPKAETPAGVGEIIQIAEGLRDFVRAAWAYIEGTEYGPDECQPNPEDWLELAGAAERLKAMIPAREQPAQIGHAVTMLIAALSTAPAARPRDEVDDARGVANVFEALWRDAEDEAARLASGFWPSDDAIAEAFHEHRRETQPVLPPWSEVTEDSGIWKHSHNFAARLSSLRPAAAPAADGGRA